MNNEKLTLVEASAEVSTFDFDNLTKTQAIFVLEYYRKIYGGDDIYDVLIKLEKMERRFSKWLNPNATTIVINKINKALATLTK